MRELARPRPRGADAIQTVGRALASALMATVLAACMVQTKPYDAVASKAAPTYSYDGAEAYLRAAESWIHDAQDRDDRFDLATKIGVGAGVGGAAVNSVFHGANSVGLGLLTGAGASYAGNQLLNASARSAILSAGLTNLACIDDAGAAAVQALRQSKDQLAALQPRIDDATAAIQADITHIQDDKPQIQQLIVDDTVIQGNVRRSRGARAAALLESQNATGLIRALDADVTDGWAAFNAGTEASDRIGAYLATVDDAKNGIGQRMFFGVQGTLQLVNDQLRAKAPNRDAFANASVSLGPFLDAQGAIRSQIQQLAHSVILANPAHAGNFNSAVQAAVRDEAKLQADMRRLHSLLTQVPDKFAVVDAAPLDRCQPVFPGDVALVVSPAGPIDLGPNGTQIETPHGGSGGPFQIKWANGAPPDVNVEAVTFDDFTLKAQSTTTEKTYHFYVKDGQGHVSNSVTLNVHKTEVAPAPAPPPPPANQHAVARRPARSAGPTPHPRANHVVASPPPRP